MESTYAEAIAKLMDAERALEARKVSDDNLQLGIDILEAADNLLKTIVKEDCAFTPLGTVHLMHLMIVIGCNVRMACRFPTVDAYNKAWEKIGR